MTTDSKPISETDFELLQTIATLNGGLDEPARLSDVAKEYDVSRQAIYVKVRRLRARGWLETPEPGRRRYGINLTHNGKLLIEIGLGAGITE